MISVQNKDNEIKQIFFPSRWAVFVAGTEVVISVIISFELQAGLLFLQGLFFLKRLAPATQAGLKAVFESFAHQIQSDWINTGIQRSHVDANVVQNQQKTQKFTSVRVTLVIKSELQDPAEVEGKPAEGKNEDQAEHRFGHFSSLL